MKEERQSLIVGEFSDREKAERAYQDLIAKGYTKDEISILMSDDTRKMHFGDRAKSDFDDAAKTDRGDNALKGAGLGGAIGGTIGATLAGILAAASTLAIPGLGLVIAGPIAGALAGAATGGAAGGIVGGLIGAGVAESDAKRYENSLKQGKVLIAVRPKNPTDYQYLEQKLHSYEVRP